ncbi:tyrosine-protein phosphatase [Priestia megaterium]|uniref:tyrosine-protein phosphatase n=1 Tax=Priestia megaterium TaxID=1404 RepID=UPI003CFC7095
MKVDDILNSATLKIESGLNFRPLGSQIENFNSHLIYRSGDPSQLKKEDIETISEIGVKCYFDLRSDEETLKNKLPDDFQKKGIDHQLTSISGYHHKFEKILYPTYEDYALYYMDILEYGKNSLHKVIKSIAYDKLPIAYGCSAGKDRTGVVSSVILKAMGISDGQIAHDYAMTSKYLLPKINYFESFWTKIGISKEDYIRRIDTKEETMYIFLELTNKKYGSIFKYLYEIGVSEIDILKIKKRLLKEW